MTNFTDGVTWTQTGATTALASATDPMLVGLATTNAVGATNAVGVFTDVNIALTNNIGATVDAGANVGGIAGQALALDATIGDDGKPAPPAAVTPLWTKRSGPGVVTFGDEDAADTSVIFDAAGNYVMRLIADDGQVKTFDDVNGTIADLPIEQWRQAKFGANANNAAIAGDLADPDGDGQRNLLEYFFNTNPLAVNAAPAPTFDGSDLVIIYRRNLAATDVIFDIRATTDFVTWSDAGETEQILSDDGITRVIRAQLPHSAETQKFYRLEVTHVAP